MTKNLIIAIDFDGTCVTHDFPKVGKDIGAVPILKRIVEKGHRIILFTMRSDVINPISDDPNIISIAGEYLTDAKNWFIENGIPIWSANENPEQKSWTHSPKPYAHMYIDDAALGCPLCYDEKISERPFVNWQQIGWWLENKGII